MGIGEVAEPKAKLKTKVEIMDESLIEKQMFNMSTKDKLENATPTFGNTVLPAVFSRLVRQNLVHN